MSQLQDVKIIFSQNFQKIEMTAVCPGAMSPGSMVTDFVLRISYSRNNIFESNLKKLEPKL